MMPRFYQIARLRVGTTIFPDAEVLRVDLDRVESCDLIENDVAFRAAAAPDSWFWLSGGGTLLLNGRYLPVVRRSADTRVNPGKFSLFTGRTDDEAERAAPHALVRELFEELLLFEDGVLLTPQLERHQTLVDHAQAAMRSAGILSHDGAERPLSLTAISLPDQVVRIRYKGVERDQRLTWAASPSNDINVLFLFGAKCDLDKLTARDGEFYRDDGGQIVHSERELFLYDLIDKTARPLTGKGPARPVGRAEMTEPLHCLIELCQGLPSPPA